MQTFSLAGIVLVWAGSSLTCLSLPMLRHSASAPPPATPDQRLRDEVNSGRTRMPKEADVVTHMLEEEGSENQIEWLQGQYQDSVQRLIRNQQVGLTNDSHGSLTSKGWWMGSKSSADNYLIILMLNTNSKFMKSLGIKYLTIYFSNLMSHRNNNMACC